MPQSRYLGSRIRSSQWMTGFSTKPQRPCSARSPINKCHHELPFRMKYFPRINKCKELIARSKTRLESLCTPKCSAANFEPGGKPVSGGTSATFLNNLQRPLDRCAHSSAAAMMRRLSAVMMTSRTLGSELRTISASSAYFSKPPKHSDSELHLSTASRIGIARAWLGSKSSGREARSASSIQDAASGRKRKMYWKANARNASSVMFHCSGITFRTLVGDIQKWPEKRTGTSSDRTK
mmetsp:Transcript_12063/g.32572  ORF Transcript_12063/g.32572 Transcript_12063/m.32572 type:complete len:237 (+) Transcript_12063:213-923(+)